MKAIEGFRAAMERADHLIRLYDLLHDTRSRRVRSDWATKFKELMRWPASEKICRVDGLEKKSILILREETGIDNAHFSHEYLSEVLRGAIVAAVSALDRYLHDLVVENCWKLLCLPEAKIPEELKRLQLPVLATKRALDRLRASQSARPGSIVKQAVQEQLHREFTFQNPSSVIKAGKMLGVADFWTKTAKKMPGRHAKAAVIEKLRKIADRRNQIVHEADLLRKTRSGTITVRNIESRRVRDWVMWVRDLGEAIEEVVSSA